MDLIWIDSTTVSLAPSRVWGIKNKTLHWAGKVGLAARDLMKKQGKIPVIPRRNGAICPGVSDRERYKTRHTVERFFAHIKEHKRLIARFDKLDATFFSFFALACLNVFKVLC